MSIDAATGSRRPRRRMWVLGGLAALLIAAVTTIGTTSLAWGAAHRSEGRLLPGTVIATVDVGGATVDEAVGAVEAHLAPELDRVIEVTHGERRWETTAAELDTTTDVEQVVAAAFERTERAGIVDLARMRWAGAPAGPELDVTVQVDDDAATAFMAAIAEEVDRDPRDAQVAWGDDGLELTEDRQGRQVDRGAAVDTLVAVVVGGEPTVELPVERLAPAVTTPDAQQVVDDIGATVEASLDHVVTLTADGASWTVSPRELEAVPDIEPLVAAALEARRAQTTADTDAPALDIDDAAVSDFIATIAADTDLAPRDAQVDWSGDEMKVTPERVGRALDRDAAGTDLREALEGGPDRVELTVEQVQPAITRASLERRTLVLRQGERRLYLYEKRRIADSWPVAVGLGGTPTPTGTFTVGAKRYEPTWTNPSPSGWGSDMPASIGPGPDNPLGLRALNWNRDGRDTLIRFHGTPDEDSVGHAASHGCVRMYNDDVVDLYNLVPSGTTILSVAG